MNSLTLHNDDQMLYVSFNQDSSCFVLGTERGFKVYSTFPFKDKFERILEGGIAIVEMLYRSNILALVGGGKCPKYNKNKVIIWDDFQSKVISEIKFTSSVKNVKLKKDKLIVICEKRIFVFNLQTYQNLDILDTYDNPKGIIGINEDPNFTVIAYPISQNKREDKGYIKIKSYEKKYVQQFFAHESHICFLCINYDGTLIATAGDTGTIIRIFRCIDGTCLQEFRRGKEKAEISYICFDQATKFLAATSDRGTIHIWSMKSVLKKIKENQKEEKKEDMMSDNTDENSDVYLKGKSTMSSSKSEGEDELPQNHSSIFKGWPNFLTRGFFKSEWSFAQVRIAEQKSICAFGPDNVIIAISSDGHYYQAKIDFKKGGDCTIIKNISLNDSENK